MNTQNGKCKQCKLDVIDETGGTEYHHIEDLRKLVDHVDSQSYDYVCAIKTLFELQKDQETSDCYFNDTVPKTSKRIPNIPLQAKPRKQPEISLCLESVRKHQLYHHFLSGKRIQISLSPQ
jgi:hypothetical protein